MWRWYVVVLGSEDGYTLYEACQIVKARSANEAKRIAQKVNGNKSYVFPLSTFGPFADKPERH